MDMKLSPQRKREIEASFGNMAELLGKDAVLPVAMNVVDILWQLHDCASDKQRKAAMVLIDAMQRVELGLTPREQWGLNGEVCTCFACLKP